MLLSTNESRNTNEIIMNPRMLLNQDLKPTIHVLCLYDDFTRDFNTLYDAHAPSNIQPINCYEHTLILWLKNGNAHAYMNMIYDIFGGDFIKLGDHEIRDCSNYDMIHTNFRTVTGLAHSSIQPDATHAENSRFTTRRPPCKWKVSPQQETALV